MNKIIKFIQEATQELGKVSWPSQPTVVRLTIGVIIVAAIFAVFIGLIDLVLKNGMEQLLILRGNNTQQEQLEDIQVTPEDIQIDALPIQ